MVSGDGVVSGDGAPGALLWPVGVEAADGSAFAVVAPAPGSFHSSTTRPLPPSPLWPPPLAASAPVLASVSAPLTSVMDGAKPPKAAPVTYWRSVT